MLVLRVALVLALAVWACLAGEPPTNPLERAKVGQWVRYKMANDMAMKQSVVKVEGAKVTIKNEMWIKGRALPVNETPIEAKKRSEPTGRVEDGRLEINGHELRCRIVTNANVKTWVCDGVPITGVVRQELNGKVTMELQGYGEAPEEDRLKKS